jgi:hypothetical protein
MATNQRKTDVDVTRSDMGRTDMDRDRTTNPDANPDPITGAPGSHPVGTGVGAATGAAAGAAIGSVFPVAGTIAGGVIGAVVGGLAGKDIAEGVNPSVEDAYWRENYKTRPYVTDTSAPYDDYAPAYRYGWESRSRFKGRHYNEVEQELATGWAKAKAESQLSWDKAKGATRDAWDRVDRSFSGRDPSETRE